MWSPEGFQNETVAMETSEFNISVDELDSILEMLDGGVAEIKSFTSLSPENDDIQSNFIWEYPANPSLKIASTKPAEVMIDQFNNDASNNVSTKSLTIMESNERESHALSLIHI